MHGAFRANATYEFGEFRLDTASRLLKRADGGAVPITGKPFDALVHLVEHAGTVVTRADLTKALWPSTVVEDNNLSRTILALRRALGDTQEAPRYVKTLPRRGYQFVAEVRTSAPAAAGSTEAPRRGRTAKARFAPLLLVVAGVAILAAFASWYREQGASGVSPASIAVLPFDNLSPREADAWFTAGMHDELLNQLARIRGLHVTARTSVLRYADTAASIGEIASELRVANVVEGSVRYADDRIRVSVRMVDGATGTESWTETYDDALGDVFAIQADIATRIATALAAELTPAERASLAVEPTESLEAYALYLQALAHYRRHGGIGVSMSPGTREAMVRHLDDALALDPDFAAALGWRAHLALDSLLFDAIMETDWLRLRAELIRRVERDAARALELDPAQGMAHVAIARLNMYRWRLDAARDTLERAIKLRPSDSVVLHYMAMNDCMLDDHSAAVRSARKALELDPKNPAPHTPLGLALRALGDRAGAAAVFRGMIEVAPTAPIGYINLARIQTDAGDSERILEALRLAEPFLDDTTRNFRVDAALSYKRAGAHADAERLIREFELESEHRHVEPGLAAMARLAVGDYAEARELLELAIATRESGMDPFTLLLIRRNTWADPVLEQPEWRSLRTRLGYAG